MGWRSWGPSRLGKGKGKSRFLRAMLGVKEIIIFICSVIISCALSGDEQGPHGKPLVEVQVPSQLLWSASFMSLQKFINEEMIRMRNMFLLNEWRSLDQASRQLYGILEKTSVDNEPPSPGEVEWEVGEEEEQHHKKHMVRQGVEELRQSSDALTEGVRLLTHELNDLFHVVLNVNTALLDNVKCSPQPHSKILQAAHVPRR